MKPQNHKDEGMFKEHKDQIKELPMAKTGTVSAMK